jgi:hypothetical protein
MIEMSDGTYRVILDSPIVSPRARLPEYDCPTPDLGPIKDVFGKLKVLHRCPASRIDKALTDAIRAPLHAITPDDLRSWYTHCG